MVHSALLPVSVCLRGSIHPLILPCCRLMCLRARVCFLGREGCGSYRFSCLFHLLCHLSTRSRLVAFLGCSLLWGSVLFSHRRLSASFSCRLVMEVGSKA